MQCAKTRDIRCGNRLFKGHGDETLRRKTVYLFGFHFTHQTYGAAGVRQVKFHEMQMRVILYAEILDPPEIRGAGPPERSIYFVSFEQQQLC